MKIHEIPWVIVQAGGKGTRLEHHVWNKPKCLVSVAGQPLLFHLFARFPAAKFVVIGDYCYETLEQYLQAFPPEVPVKLIRTKHQGTLSGLDQALTYVSDRDPFLLIWCDLLIERLPDCEVNGKHQIGLSRSFKCRWSYTQTGACVEEGSVERGIAGFFIFQNKAALKEIPSAGEWVRWLAQQPIEFDQVFLDHTCEIGTLESLAAYQKTSLSSRFFNAIEITDDQVIKKARVQEFEPLIAREINWYKTVGSLGFDRIPTLVAEAPMTISRIPGAHPFELESSLQQKIEILTQIFQLLDRLHSLDQRMADPETLKEVYLKKTCDRVNHVARLIPFFDQPTIQINDCLCRNPFHVQSTNWLAELVAEIQVDRFMLIHGDPTFSNILIDPQNQVWFIDPRGYFGSSLLYGDPMYDWAKLYYSVVGDYDAFNRRRFKLKVVDQQVEIQIESNGWKELEPMFKEKFSAQMPMIRLLHALIWLSLAGYVTDDYDSILASFYNGLFWLEKAVE